MPRRGPTRRKVNAAGRPGGRACSPSRKAPPRYRRARPPLRSANCRRPRPRLCPWRRDRPRLAVKAAPIAVARRWPEKPPRASPWRPFCPADLKKPPTAFAAVEAAGTIARGQRGSKAVRARSSQPIKPRPKPRPLSAAFFPRPVVGQFESSPPRAALDHPPTSASFPKMAQHAIFLSGPVGVGKTSLGRALAERLLGGFIDGDDFSDPDRPWYCSILQTSRAIVQAATTILKSRDAVVVAYPLGCVNSIYFRRKLGDAGVMPLFVGLRASYSSIVDERRGRTFSSEERDRIQIMIAESYGARPFSDLVLDTDTASFLATLAQLEREVRRLIPS
jgi:hypothetical protein